MRYEKEYPLIKTKTAGLTNKFDLSDPAERKKYFQAKTGKEIEKINHFFKAGKTFIAYLLAKKLAGKGTFIKLFVDIFGEKFVKHISVGDVIRDIHKTIETNKGQQEIKQYLENNYRGFLTIDECIKAILNRNQSKTISDDLTLALIQREIDKHPNKTLFIDGFPRTMDQISYSLYFKALINHRQDPDLFITIDIPESIIDARMKKRVVCPKCQNSRNLQTMTTKKVGYDKAEKEFYLICDNPNCTEEKMIKKEGDEAGIQSIRERLDKEGNLMKKIFSLQGVPKILLRNAVPVTKAKEYVDDYEITPYYYYEFDEKSNKVKTLEKPWVVKDDHGEEAYSLLSPAIVVQLIKQLAEKIA